MSFISTPEISQEALASFHKHLASSNRVLALLGAGISASSGLPTFRGAGGLWRTHDSISLASHSAFIEDPGLVWQFYSYRRNMALSVDPNPAHYALAELSRRMPGFLTLSQNVDGLSQRANHPSEQLLLLHGTLFNVKCTNSDRCGYSEPNFVNPIVPALAIPTDGTDPTSNEARQDANDQLMGKRKGKELDISDASVTIPTLTTSELPHCPKCKKNLLRPGVVWFGEALPSEVLHRAEEYLNQPEGVDLIIVIGTSSTVYPAAGYVGKAKSRGAKVCVVNMEANTHSGSWSGVDWFFQGDAAKLVPELLKPVIGEVKMPKPRKDQ